MKILSVKIKGVDHQLKEPIEISEDISYSKGKQMFELTNSDFHLIIWCRDKEVGRLAIQEEMDMIVDSYLFDPDYVLSQDAIELKERIKRHVYG